VNFDAEYAAKILPVLLQASIVNITAAVAAFGLALVGGLGLALAGTSTFRVLPRISRGVIEVVRDTPFLVQLYFIFYVLPQYHIIFDPLMTGILALGLHFSAYTAEVYRSGIESVARGQWEAATALNFSGRDTWFRIILPQAIPPTIPALGNYLIGMFKDTAIFSTIAVREMLGTGLSTASLTFRSLEPVLLVGIIFLAMSLTASVALRYVGAKVATT
jgi:polar amino acid transport system permease protein